MENRKLNIENALLNEQELENVDGGVMVTTNQGFYESGSTPKYHVGQTLEIEYLSFPTCYRCTCVVINVNAEKSGACFKEFTYRVEIIEVPEEVARIGYNKNIIGRVYECVFESCLYEK